MTFEDTMRSLGARPYIPQDWDDDLGTVVEICPTCQERIALYERADFESFTGRESIEHQKVCSGS